MASSFPSLSLNGGWRAQPPRSARVCIASYELLGPSRNGGIGTGYSSLASALADAGHEVTLLYLFRDWCENGTVGEWQAYYRERGIRFYPLPSPPSRMEASQHVATSYDAYQWLRARDFDVIHFPELLGHGYYSVLAKHQGLDFRDTVICIGVHSPISWIREINRELPLSSDEPEIDFMERESVASADVVVSPSQYLLGWIQAKGWRLPPTTYVQQYVLSPELWSCWEQRSDDRRLRHVNGITFFGRLEERKGIALFCDALDRLLRLNPPKFTVTFLGKIAKVAGRDAASYIEDRARHWPFDWQIISDRDQSGALELLRRSSNVAVIPSLEDNLPNAVLECLCANIPFVASRAGGIPEAIAPEHLELVTFPTDPAVLASRLCDALRTGVPIASPAVDPKENRRQWVAWHGTHRTPEGEFREAVLETNGRKPLVSVCLSQGDRPKFLRQALASIDAQTWPNVEVIVIAADAGSDSDTDLGRAEVPSGTRTLRMIGRRRDRVGDPRDVAAASANGDYLLFMDESSLAKPEAISTFVQVAERSNADILTCFLDLFSGEDGPANGVELGCLPFLGAALIPGIFRNYFGRGSLFIRRSAVEQRLGGFAGAEPGACEDWEFLTRVVLSGARLKVVPRALAWYRVDNPAQLEGGNANGDGVRRLKPYLEALPTEFRELLRVALSMKLQSNGHAAAGNHRIPMSDEELLRLVRERLNSSGSHRRIALFLNEWSDYNTARVNLPAGRWQRLPYIARQLMKRRYHRFAHGFGSALRDLRKPPKPPGSLTN
jgi:O-antigen biosynthesis protein